MSYTVIGLAKSGNLSIHDRGLMDKPTEAALEQMCHNLGYTQVLVCGAGFGSYAKRYVFDNEPRLRQVTL